MAEMIHDVLVDIAKELGAIKKELQAIASSLEQKEIRFESAAVNLSDMSEKLGHITAGTINPSTF